MDFSELNKKEKNSQWMHKQNKSNSCLEKRKREK